jgi:uncharacterized protein (TIGR00251 family)
LGAASGLEVLVRPGASRDQIGGEHDGALVIRLQAPPVEGRANTALVKLIARRVGVPRSSVKIVRGRQGRRKVVSVEGLAAERLRARLESA